MKLIFLDIDGVLNSTASCLVRTPMIWFRQDSEDASNWIMELLNSVQLFGYGVEQSVNTVDPTAVELLNRLVEKSGANIVLSSSHRSFFTGANYNDVFEYGSPEHIHALDLYLKILGVRAKLVGITPRLFTRRGVEVREYLNSLDEEPEAHVAIDDGGDFKSHECNLVRTDARLGFTSNEYFEAAKILGVQESTIIF